MFRSVKERLKRPLNKLLLRPLIADIRSDVRTILKGSGKTRQTLEIVSDSVLIVDKKLEYLSVKIDAHAEVDDQFKNSVLSVLREIRSSLELANRTAADLETKARNLQKIGDRIGEEIGQIATKVYEVQSGTEWTHSSIAGIDSNLGRLSEVLGRVDTHVSAVQASKEHTDGAIDGIDRRLTRLGEVLGRVDTHVSTVQAGKEQTDRSIDVIDRSVTRLAEMLGQVDAKVSAVKTCKEQTEDAVAGIDRNITRLGEQIDESTRTVISSVEKTALNEFRQTESLAALSKLLDLKLPLPATRGWAASPDFLRHLYHHITEQRPRLVVELGSGVSTVVAAAALKANDDGGRIYSLDHHAEFSEATSRMLEEQGLAEFATVHHAPLGLWKPDFNTKLGEEWQWYSVPGAVDSLRGINLLIIDGPPKAAGRYARFPAVPHFRDRMASDCVVLLDDAHRDEEKKAVEVWASDWALKLDFGRGFEKGLAVLTAESSHAGD